MVSGSMVELVPFDTYKSVSDFEIASFEKAIDGVLPEDYRDFLRQTNGGRFHGVVQDLRGYGVEMFLGIDSSGSSDCLSLLNVLQIVDWIKLPYLPFAAGYADDYFCVVVDGASKSGILRFSLDDPQVPERLAGTFLEFWRSLSYDIANDSDDSDFSKASHAIDVNDLSRLTALVNADPSSMQKYDSEGRTLLMRAAWNARTKAMILLHERGAEVDACNDRGRTALFMAIACHSPVSIKLLISLGADSSILDRDGLSPLMYAVKIDSIRSVEALLSCGVDPHFRSANGATALSLCESTQEEVRDLLTKVVPPAD